MAEIIAAMAPPIEKRAGLITDNIVSNNTFPQSGLVDTLIRSESMMYTN